ncbi:MAG: AlbA family DNA-binding domain-containing protein, partial [Thermoanaerobaculia bacterium]
MIAPLSLEELRALISNGIQESLHLDYKRSAAFVKKTDHIRFDLAKDVSAFANSDGGVLIYGMIEEDNLPKALDEGIDHSEWTRERIEGILTGNISPRLDGLNVEQIRASATHSYYVIRVPKSYRGPHQETIEKRYYKRFNFKSVPMEDYEIRDVLNRRDIVPSLISVDIELRKGILLELVISNIGDTPAEDVRFTIQPPIEKLAQAKFLTDGSAYFPPGKRHQFFFGSALEEVRRENAPRFDVSVSYYNRRADQRLTDVFHIDLSDYFLSSIVESDLTEHSKRLQEALGKVTSELERIHDVLRSISSVAGPTGLDLSVTSIRNLQHLRAGEERIERIPATGCDWTVFAEVLEIDRHLALKLSNFAKWGETRKLEDIQGLPRDVVER